MSHYECKVCHQYYDDCECGKSVATETVKYNVKQIPALKPGEESEIIRDMGDDFEPVQLSPGYGQIIEPERDIIKRVFEISDEITAGGHTRYVPAILAKSTEEIGELATEVGIRYFGFYKQPGKDGIFGEACDVINCMLDIIHVAHPEITAEEVYDKIAEKTAKWKSKTIGN